MRPTGYKQYREKMQELVDGLGPLERRIILDILTEEATEYHGHRIDVRLRENRPWDQEGR